MVKKVCHLRGEPAVGVDEDVGFAVDVDTDVAVGVDGDDDCVGDGLVGDAVEVGNIGLARGAGVDLEVSAFVADLGVHGGDVERNG